ncbi:Phosphatase_1 regulatory subunit [Hexamita inflata]|uniref:Phosphatase 1 regulatory subunit n=1 Tax=Hexamita inflata TaxID=28002 RepID=A0AA86R3Q2_9EUKA|nr:Phosphatase 1 regulatory subunit [Hexamita inflata]
MKSIEDKAKPSCIVTQHTKFTDQNIKDATHFTADNFIVDKVDKVPTCAVSIKMVNCSLCSCKGLDFHQSLTHLDLSSNYLEQVSGLENISGLEYVDFSNNFITDISVLAGKYTLKVLKIANNMIFNLDIVSSLPLLQELDYANNHVYSQKPAIIHPNFKPYWVSQQRDVSLQQCMDILNLTKEQAILVFKEAENNKIWEYIVQMVLKFRDQIQKYDEEVSLSINDNQQITSLIFIQYLNVTCLKLNRCYNVNFSEVSHKLKHLFVSNSKVQSLQGIQNFTQLETLGLRNNGLCSLPDELSLISQLTNLRSLNIAQNGLEDLSWLKLNQLESLNVSENSVKDESALAEFKDLKNLDISFNLVESVDALRNLVQIEQLNISHNKINNINCLNQLQKLAYFNITCNRIISVEVCLVMKLLVDLRTDQNAICDIDKLTKHQNTTVFWVTSQDEPTDAEIKQYFSCDESEVQRKKKILVNQKQQSIYYSSMILRYKTSVFNDSLEISNDNELQSIYFSDLLKATNALKVSSCPNVSFDPHSALVQHLIVQNCKLDNILNLEQMTQLVSLDLSGNELRYVLELGELVNLKTLILKDNKIARIENWIQNLTAIQHIDMQNNKLILVKQLLELPLLKTVLLQGNMIRDIEFLKRHRKYNITWIQPQNIPTTKDYEYHIGDNRDDQMVLELIQQIDLERYSLQKADMYQDSIQEEELTLNNDPSLYDLGFLDPQNEFLQKNTKILTIKFCSEVQTLNTPNILIKLTINNCELVTVKGLEKVINLTHLDLSSNQLTEISVLQTLFSLEQLVLNNNKIIRIDCLGKLVNLKNFEMKNNKLFNANVSKFWKNITKLFVNDNFINDFTELFNHDNYNPLWISPQKIPGIEDVKKYLQVEATQDQIDAELAKFNNNKQCTDKKHSDQELMQKLKNQINDNQLEIIDNEFVQDLNFANHFKLNKLVLNNCINVKFDYVCNVKTLHIINCSLACIDFGIQKMLQLQELNLGKNNLEDVSVLGSLLNLQTLVLNDNLLRDLSCLKPLVKLVHLDVRRNKLLEVDFVLELKELKYLLLEGNMIYHCESLQKHLNYNNWIEKQNPATEDDIIIRFGKDNVLNELSTLQKQKDVYNKKMIAKYKNRVRTHQITVENVSQNHIDQIDQNLKNCNREKKGTNYLLYCTQEYIQTILNQIKAIDPNLKTTQKPFRFLMISEDNELEELGFTNEFNLQKLCVQDSKNVKFTEIVDVKIFFAITGEIDNLEGLQNWTKLQELYLYKNNLKNIQQLQNLTNLTELDIRVNFIKDFTHISNHPNFAKYLIDRQK